MKTEESGYTQRLEHHQGRWWKRLLDVQRPYRWNIRRIAPGFVLDVGCGLGRNLAHLDGHGVGLDHNPHSIEFARTRGLQAFTPDEFRHTPYFAPGRFDSLLFAHVAEHMPHEQFIALVKEYAPLVRDDGKLILICPQEAGYRTDATHVEFMDFTKLRAVAIAVGFEPVLAYSFPFPRAIGRVFVHNEFVVVSRKTAKAHSTP